MASANSKHYRGGGALVTPADLDAVYAELQANIDAAGVGDPGSTFFPLSRFTTATSSQTVTSVNDYVAVPFLIPYRTTITGIRYRCQATGGATVYSGWYNSAGSQLAAQTSGTAQTTNAINSCPFASPVTVNPGVYWGSLTFAVVNTGTFTGCTAAAGIGRNLGGAAGGAQAPASLTPPSNTTQGTAQFIDCATY